MGQGTVFSITTDRSQRMPYDFHPNPDANGPLGAMIIANGKLYGMAGGGRFGKGAIFSVTTTGSEKVLHSFGSHPQDAEVASPAL